jgi:hypothetical protein
LARGEVRNLLAYRGAATVAHDALVRLDAAEVTPHLRALEARFHQVVKGVPRCGPGPDQSQVRNVQRRWPRSGTCRRRSTLAWIETAHSAKSSAAQIVSCQNDST